MIQFASGLWSRLVPLVVLFAAMALGAGCALRPAEEEAQSTPAAPVWRPDEVGRTLRALERAGPVLQRSGSATDAAQRAGRVADYLASRLHDYHVQPAAAAYRLHYPVQADTASTATYLPLVSGIVSGRGVAAAEKVVIVYAALGAEAGEPAVPAAWLELSRVYGELVRFYRFPARSILFLMPVGANHEAVLEAYRRQPVWPMEQVRAVLSLGTDAPDADAWHRIGVPGAAEVSVLAPAPAGEEDAPALRAVELARSGYAWLLPHVSAPADRPLWPAQQDPSSSAGIE